jgi:hypothetical protein
VQFSKLTHYYLNKWHDKKNYVVQNKFVVFITLVNFIVIILLISGHLPIYGINLKGRIVATNSHCHGIYDHSFVTGLDENGSIQGTSLEAVNIRATGGAITGWYYLNEGAVYQHGGIIFSEVNYPKNDFPLGVPYFQPTLLMITPDFEKERINFINSAYVDKEGLHGLSDKEIERIADKLKLNNLVTCGGK